MQLLFLNKSNDQKILQYNNEFYNYLKNSHKIYFSNHHELSELQTLTLDFLIGHDTIAELIYIKKNRQQDVLMNTIYALIVEKNVESTDYRSLEDRVLCDLIDLYIFRTPWAQDYFIIKYNIPKEKTILFPFYGSIKYELCAPPSKSKKYAVLGIDPDPFKSDYVCVKDPAHPHRFELVDAIVSGSTVILPDKEEFRDIVSGSGIFLPLDQMGSHHIQEAMKKKDNLGVPGQKPRPQAQIFQEMVQNLDQFQKRHSYELRITIPHVQQQLAQYQDKDYQKYISACRSIFFPNVNQYYQMNLHLGMAHYKLKQFDEGREYYKIAQRLQDSYQINLNIALLEDEAGQQDKFVEYAKRALAKEFNVALAMKLALEIYYGHFSESLTLYKKILCIEPLNGPVLTNVYTLASFLDINLLGEKNIYEEKLEKACYLALMTRNIHDLLLLVSNLQIGNLYFEGKDDYLLGRLAVHYSALIPTDDDIVTMVKGHLFHRNEKKRRMGFILSDLKKHPVGDLLLLLLQHHNKDLFEMYVYDNTGHIIQPNNVLESTIRVAKYRKVHGISDVEAVRMILDDNLDVLIEMMGYTSGNRMHLMKHKLAPKMMSYFAYPFTNGMPTIDYKIVDQYTCPLETQKVYTEKFLYLPQCLQCYQSDIPVVKNYTRESPYRIHLCCFNNPKKLTRQVIKTFATILVRAPHAKLFLMYCMWYNDAYLIKVLRTMFESFGVQPGQIDITTVGDPTLYMQRYNHMDIALDPFPYNGGITSHEALFMGTPLICLNGKDYRARVGVSLLSNLHLTRYIAMNECEYVEKTLQLMNDEKELRYLHTNLRAMMKKTDLGDPKAFSKHFEEAILNAL